MTNRQKFDPQEKSTEVAIRFANYVRIGYLLVENPSKELVWSKKDMFNTRVFRTYTTEELFEIWLDSEFK